MRRSKQARNLCVLLLLSSGGSIAVLACDCGRDELGGFGEGGMGAGERPQEK